MQTEKTLTALVESLSAQLEAVKKMTRKKDVIQTLDTIQEAASSTAAWLVENKKRKYIGTRKVLVAISNSVDGLKTGLMENELSPKQLLAGLKHLDVKFVSKASSLIESDSLLDTPPVPEVELTEAQQETKAILEKSVSNSEWQESLKVVQNALIKKRDDLASGPETANKKDADIQKSLDAVVSAVNRLPTTLKSSFGYARAPIIPIFNNTFGTSIYAKSALQFVEIEGYVILPDQLTLLISKKLAAKQKNTPIQYAQVVLNMLNDRGNEHYSMVSETGKQNPRNADLVMFWIMPSNRLIAFRKHAGPNFKTLNWGLPV